VCSLSHTTTRSSFVYIPLYYSIKVTTTRDDDDDDDDVFPKTLSNIKKKVSFKVRVSNDE
jgi:hypothetical protein